jgi:hypothetical protein
MTVQPNELSNEKPLGKLEPVAYFSCWEGRLRW